ncbi:glycosyltransferase family 2 protein [bacterium]|nr:glycosyltransferase family 2 protein [bacterium]
MVVEVSVILYNHNEEKTVVKMVNEIFNQTYKNIEIIVVDDASTDETNLLKQLTENDDRIHVIKNRNKLGVSKSLNMAVEQSHGKYILPVTQETDIDKDFVEKGLKILKNDINSGIIYKETESEDNNSKLNKDVETMDREGFFPYTMFRKQDFVKAGGYTEYLSNGSENYDLWINIIENDCNAVGI